MADNEFDDDDGLEDSFDEFSEDSGSSKSSLKNNPLVKVGIVVGVVGVIFVVINVLNSEVDQATGPSYVGAASDVSVAPATEEASPSYIQAIEEINEADRERAEATGGSALPVPIEPPVGIVSVPEQAEDSEDPLQRWRRLQEERLQKEIQQRETIDAVSTQTTTNREEVVSQLADLMQEQMTSILESKNEVTISSLNVTDTDFLQKLNGEDEGEEGEISSSSELEEDEFEEEVIQEVLLPAGEIAYAQLLTEANTDSPGPVLAQILAGPLAGSRVIGTFESQNDLLTLNFDTVVVGEESLSVDAVALDPETTLPGMATEVDHRYFRRILLPAAAAFIEGLSSAIAEGGTTNITVNAGGGSTAQTDEDLDNDQEVATGVAEAGQELREILDDMADDTRVLIRLEAGTPIGILFLEPVETEDDTI